MKRCVKCGLPETHETIEYDSAGVCNICKQHKYKSEQVDWEQKKSDLRKLVEQYRGNYDYDCIVPFSGGKDSTWTLYYLVKEFNLKPLVVRFDHGFLRPNLEKNVKKTIRKLGVDMVTFTPNWHLVRKLMLQSLLEKGDFCWHCHTGIFSYPMWVALEKRVPLIFWGEPSAEYTSYYDYEDIEEVDEKRFNRYINLGINSEDMHFRMGGGLDERDFKPYTYPPIRDLRELKYRSVCLGSFIPWDVRRQSTIIEQELGWKGDQVENVPPQYGYEKIECYMQGVRDYIKYMKRGYTRPSHLVALDIRNERLDLDRGKVLIETYEGRRPPSLDLFLSFLGITENEFNEIVARHQVSPYVHKPSQVIDGVKTDDFEEWCKDGLMDRNETDKQLEHWMKCNNCEGFCS